MYASKQKLSENISSLVSSVICSIDNDLKLTVVSNHNLQYYNKHSSQHLIDWHSIFINKLKWWCSKFWQHISRIGIWRHTHIYDKQFHNCGSTLIYMIDNSSRVHKFTNSNQVHKLRPHHKSMAHHKNIAHHKSMAHHSLGHITV